MTRRDLKAIGALRIVANAAQLSIRDLRYRPLRAVVQQSEGELPSPLEKAVLSYVDSLDD